jgi:hypothetical protein
MRSDNLGIFFLKTRKLALGLERVLVDRLK